eukprot:1136272-Pelagomonas_calceolata.AAC.2
MAKDMGHSDCCPGFRELFPKKVNDMHRLSMNHNKALGMQPKHPPAETKCKLLLMLVFSFYASRLRRLCEV